MDQKQLPSKKKSPRVLKIISVVIGVILIIGIAYIFYQKRIAQELLEMTNCKPGYLCMRIETEGKINVSNTPEVQVLAEKYGWEHVHIQALDIDLVKDIEFIKQIHPNFKEETGCIIVVHADGEGYVYQEDKELNIIYQETLAEFMETTKNVDSELMSKFYFSLH